jgi:hypothetical protein
MNVHTIMQLARELLDAIRELTAELRAHRGQRNG